MTMPSIHEHLRCPLTRQRDTRDRETLLTTFPALQACGTPHYLAVRRYVHACPDRFFSRESFDIYLTWIQARDGSHRASLKRYFADHQADFDRALLFLREINLEGWHDAAFDVADDYDLVRSIDTRVHPTYLRLVEGVFTPLLRVVAHFSRVDRSKGTDGLDVWSVTQELNVGPLAPLVRACEHLIRNGIAHGGVTFLQREIRYRDKKGNEATFAAHSVVRLFDDLLDTCNGVAAALKVFFAICRDHGYVPPREVLIEELQEETSTPWWRIEGCVEAQIAGKSQLTIFARPDTRDFAKVQWSVLQSGILAEYFAPGYDRYFLSLHSPKAWPGWAAFDGQRLRDLRTSGEADLREHMKTVEDGLIFFVSKVKLPRFVGRIETLCASIRLHLPTAMDEIRSARQLPRIICRSVAVHRNSWGAVIRGSVVIDGLQPNSVVRTIRDHRKRIMGAVVAQARRENRGSAAAYLPVGFAQVHVFQRDYRRRRLTSYGLSQDLICTIRLHRLRRIQCPDIVGSTVESNGNWRIAWNRAWLDYSGEGPECGM